MLICRGCPSSDDTARWCLGILKPKLPDVDVESWEELDDKKNLRDAHSLRFLVWPGIGKNRQEEFSAECPRVTVNPDLSTRRGGSQVLREAWSDIILDELSTRRGGSQVPREAGPDIILDEPFVQDIDPETWAVSGFRSSNPKSETSKDRPAPEPDIRLTRKRAKNMRQHQRRANRQ